MLFLRLQSRLQCSRSACFLGRQCLRQGEAIRAFSIVRREVVASRLLLSRSGFNSPAKLERLLGVKLFHTSSSRQQDGGRNNKDEDEKQRMLSVLKTAAAVLILYEIISRSRGREEPREQTNFTTNLERSQRPDQPLGQISWNDFKHNLLLKGEVAEIIIQDSGLNLATAILHPGAMYKGQRVPTQLVRVEVNVDTLEDKIREAESEMGISSGDQILIHYRREHVNAGAVLRMLLAIGILATLAWGLRKVVGGPNGPFGKNSPFNPFQSMGKANFTLIDPAKRKGGGVKFDHVAGLKQPKIELLEFVDLIKNPEKYIELGAKPPKGALLLGPPGCGKTMLAKAVANEANVPFLSMAGSEFIEMIGGLGASRVRSLFSEAKNMAPSIIFIDEIDAIGRQRKEGASAAGESGREADQTLNQLLVEMDGISSVQNVILLASTNRPDVLDKALLRRGRFDRHITIDLPTLIERKEIFEAHLSTVVLEDDKTTYSQRLSTLTPGFSGADIANVVNEAALHAARELQDKIKKSDLEYAIERVIAGPEKRTSILNPHEKNIVAYHESGHALVGWLLQHTDALLKVTILPRTSQALGFAQYTPNDKKLYSPEELMDTMCMALGGRVAESLTFNRITTGAQNDLEKVTKMAYAQIREFGFNSTVGHVSFQLTGGKKPYSKRLANTIDLEAKTLIADAYKRTEQLLSDNKDKLEMLAQLLLKKETLNYQDLEDLLGPPPFGKKHLVNPLDYERQLDEQAKLGEEGQHMT